MDQRAYESLCARLEEVERQNRRLRAAGIYVLVGFVALVVVGVKYVQNRGVIEAEGFVLKDRSGAVRGRLALQKDGSPALEFVDKRGRQLVSLRSTMDNTAELSLYSKGQSGIVMYTSSTGAATLNFLDPSHAAASGFYLKEDGTLGLDLRGDLRSLGLSVAPDGAAKIAFKDQSGRSLGGMAVNPDGTAEVGMADEASNVAGHSDSSGVETSAAIERTRHINPQPTPNGPSPTACDEDRSVRSVTRRTVKVPLRAAVRTREVRVPLRGRSM